MEQPPGFEQPNCPRKDFVLLVNKGLYGLKQSGSLYANDQKQKLMDLGFVPSDADECVYISADKRLLSLHMSMMDSSAPRHKKKSTGSSPNYPSTTPFAISALPQNSSDLTSHRPDPRGPITISQGTYARKLLAKFGMADCNPVKAPCDQRASYLHLRTETESPSRLCSVPLYNFLDHASRHLDSPRYRLDYKQTLSIQQGSLRTPHGCRQTSLPLYPRNIGLRLHLLSLRTQFPLWSLHRLKKFLLYAPPRILSMPPAHLIPMIDARPPAISSYYFGAGIVWGSRKQTYAVALSSMEGEYLALTEAAKEAIFLRQLLSSINIPQKQPTLILTDSDAALKHVKNNVNHSRSKHIDTRHHFIRHAFNSGDVDIRHIPAASQTADILTKPLGTIKHQEAVKLLQLHDSRYT